MTKISRRKFLQLTGVSSLAASTFLFGGRKTVEAATTDGAVPLRIRYAKEVPTTCPYCSLGCGSIVHVAGGEVISIAGDPDHPINEGALCSKGASIFNLRRVYDSKTGKSVLNPSRVTEVLYRAPNSDQWQVKNWDWALREIATRVKKARDASFERLDANGVTVNRTTAIAHLGSAALECEENYLMNKLFRAIGGINMCHHARL